MSLPDEDLREVFREARDVDREAAPPFETMLARARSRGNARGAAALRRLRPWGLVFLGAASAAAVVMALQGPPRDPQRVEPVEEVALTTPTPDIPLPGQAELANWEEEVWTTPTDFLLEEEGVLAGGIPTDDVFEDTWKEL